MPKIMARKRIKFLSILLTVSLLSLVVAIVLPGTAQATEYDETNPELTYTIVNSDVEVTYNVQEYTPYGKYTEGGGQYTLETDGYVVWDKKDDFYFGYRQYDIGSSKTDTLTVETDLTEFKAAGNGSKYFTASAGIMIRGSLDPSAPSILVHVREGAIGVLCRKSMGAGTSYTASGAQPTAVTGLKIEKTGDKYVCSYKLQGLGWIAFKTVRLDWDGPFFAGLALHSSDKDNPVQASFSGFKASGSGTYTPGESSDNTSSETVSVVPWEDAPMPDNCLLYETFTDTNLEERDGKTPDKPIWESFSGTIEIDQNGNRRKYNNSLMPCADCIGDSKWTDYSASMDFQVTSDTDPKDDDYFTFVVRNKTIETTGRYGYQLKFTSTYDTKTQQTTCFVEVRRMFRSDTKTLLGKTEIPSYFDYKTHNIQVDVVDNTLKLYYDYTPITFTVGNVQTQTLIDTTAIVMATGGLRITTSDSIDIYFDNIIVTKLNDPVGGDYDNFIGGNWDSDIPEYAEEFSEKYGKALY